VAAPGAVHVPGLVDRAEDGGVSGGSLQRRDVRWGEGTR
jgi:hypothetical protein